MTDTYIEALERISDKLSDIYTVCGQLLKWSNE